jgi:hypothetical protein
MTPREEKFARLIVEGKSQSEAYRISHPHSKRWKPDSIHQSASKLAAKVQSRVKAMQDEAKERSLLTLEDHMAKLQELRDMAANAGTLAPAITAEVKRGELMGYYVARSENVNTNFVISGSPDDDDADSDPEQWAERHRPN